MKRLVGLLSLALIVGAGTARAASVSWTYEYDGHLELQNNSTSTASVTLDTYFGDQTVCGTTLSCYYHNTPTSGITVAGSAKVIDHMGKHLR